MKYFYRILQRPCIPLMVALLILMFFVNPVVAQRPQDVYPGVLHIKFSEPLAAQLEQQQITKRADNVVVTGIQSLDNVNLRFKATGIRRVFRPGGKFEAKHRRYGLHRWYEVALDKAASMPEVLAAYNALPGIEKTEPVYKKAIIGSSNKNYGPVVLDKASLATLPGQSNDPLVGNQWHYNNTGQTGGTPGADIRLFQAWGIETGSSSVIVAVTDGGIQVNHPDIAANMWVNTDEVPGNNVDDDNNGYVDDINGYGFGDDTGAIAPDAHGTHVGGTIAAVTNNGVGVAGVAGGSGIGDGVRLMSCAAFGDVGTGGFPETYIYGADNGAVISQNSWGYTSAGSVEQAVLDAIDYFIAEAGKDENGVQIGPMNGGIVIFAAGNDDDDGDWYPGFYAPTLAVSGTTHQDKKAWYSNYGDWVDIAAPGGETSGVPAEQGVLSTLSGSQYGYFQGTSMACPHVSGAAALIISKYGGPGFSPQTLRARLVQTTDNIDAADPPFAGLLGSGRLNAFAALQQNDNAPPEAINDLEVQSVAITAITLTWTSPADPGNGSATTYDIRYDTSPINAANFDDATAVANPPAPKPAGSTEVFTVTGLLPGTTYYFAVKSADFFGNASAISNVVSETTNFAPAIAVHPSSLNDTLQTAQTSVQPLTIINTGQGPLTFSFEGLGAPEDFATPSPTSGTIATGDSLTVNVEFDAAGLLAGTYEQELLIVSNDPLQDTLVVPATLWVINNGAPIASVEPDSLNFGNVFQNASKTLTVVVSNAGSEPLEIVSITSDHPDFTAEADTLQIPPLGNTTVSVTFTPSELGVAAAFLSITTNDPVDTTVVVFLTGNGVEAPDIEVTPPSITETLNTGDTVTRTVTITNTGASDLAFSVNVSAGTNAAITTKEVSLPVGADNAPHYSGQKKSATAGWNTPSTIKLRSVGTSATTTTVLIITPDNNVQDLATILNGFEDVQADIFPKPSLPGITLADLEGYDIVMTTNNTQWQASGNISPVAIGNLLADYIDQGGKVIVNQFAYSYDAWKMSGRFIDEQYGPFTPSTADEDIQTSLDDILAPNHPVVEGVSTLTYSGYVQNVGLAPGATALATWANGDLLLAVNQNVVALNLLPSLGNGGPLQWTGDLPTIYQNAIHWLSGPSFITVTPESGVVAPGQQTDLTVVLDATGLAEGTFTANIDISSNVPGKALVTVPVTMNVVGPEFSITPDSLSEVLEKGETASHTLTLRNEGTGDFTYEITIENKGVSAVYAKNKTASDKTIAPEVDKKEASAGTTIDRYSTKALYPLSVGETGRPSVAPSSVDLYRTDFEEFEVGNINGQMGWVGQFGNWTIDTSNPASGQKHFHGLSDGEGQSLAFSPNVAIGTEAKSSTTMKLNIQGSGVTWQIIPQSPTAELVNTRLEFSPDGSVKALVDDGAGGSYVTVPAPVPAGYFDLAIEVDRASFVFDVYFNKSKVFTGQGFSGDVEEVVVYSAMEIEGPTLDLDDLKIIDGTHETIPPYLTVSPLSGTLAAGQSVEIEVTFDATLLGFGTYRSDIKIDIAGGVGQLVVPTTLTVIGEAAIEVEPLALEATANYGEETTENLVIRNTGGEPLIVWLEALGEEDSLQWLTVSPITDTIAVRGQANVTAHFDAQGLAPGTYNGTLWVHSNATADSVIEVTVSLEVLEPAQIGIDPDALYQELVSGYTATQTLQISNSGESPLRFSFEGMIAPGPTGKVMERRVSSQIRTARSSEKINLLDATAIKQKKVSQHTAELYATSFEEFATGDIDEQNGWAAQFGNWTVENENPWTGAQHFRGVADGLGQSLAFSPEVAAGTDSISSTTLKINPDEAEGVTWQIIPQSVSAGFVNTRLQISDDGSLFTLVQDSAGNGAYVPVTATLPEGYSEVRIDVNRATAVFTIYIGGESVFTGQGFAGDIEQVVILSLMEVEGPVLDIDNFAILDGAPQPPWLLVNPVSGVVEQGSTLPVTVTFDARQLSGGTYRDSLVIVSNDPDNAVSVVPVTLNVIPPPVIDVEPDSLHQEVYVGATATQPLTVFNKGTADLRFTFLGYGPTSTDQNNVSRIYANAPELKKGEPDLRKGHPVLFGRGGPDKSGYTWMDSDEPGGPSFQWNDIAATGTKLVLADDDAETITLPFIFHFYGAEKSNVSIGSNGYLTFSADGSLLSNEEIPDASTPNDYIAPLWDDLNPAASGAAVYYQAYNDKFVVQYTNVPVFLGDVPQSFQVVLHASGSIQYYYLAVDTERESATTGIENATGTDGLQVAFNTNYVKDSLAITLTQALPWITVQPSSGTLSGGSSQVVSVGFSAEELTVGDYHGELYISSNDLERPITVVPVSMTVFDNYAPVLGVVKDTSVVETGSLKLTFTATDEDDEQVTVSLQNPPSFASLVSTANGTVTYEFKPRIGDAGDYDLVVLAKDARGKSDTATFTLTVLPYGVYSFSLVNVFTGATILDFEDSVTIDVASPDYGKYTIRANTNPRHVGSVQFRIDGKKKTQANHYPYLLNSAELFFLSAGDHTLEAQAFTKSGGRGDKGVNKRAVISVVNSATVTGIEVINTFGRKLKDLHEGDVINIRDNAYKRITLKAKTGNRGVGSVRFDLNGNFYRLDDHAPFTLTGDLFGIYFPWPAAPGNYTLTVTPYSKAFGLGVPGTPLTIHFEVVNTSSALAKADTQSRSALTADDEREDGETSLSLYPVPVNDQLNIRWSGKQEGKVQLIIRNAQGQLVYKSVATADALRNYSVSTHTIGLSSGVYYLQLLGPDGSGEIKKFIKE